MLMQRLALKTLSQTLLSVVKQFRLSLILIDYDVLRSFSKWCIQKLLEDGDSSSNACFMYFLIIPAAATSYCCSGFARYHAFGIVFNQLHQAIWNIASERNDLFNHLVGKMGQDGCTRKCSVGLGKTNHPALPRTASAAMTTALIGRCETAQKVSAPSWCVLACFSAKGGIQYQRTCSGQRHRWGYPQHKVSNLLEASLHLQATIMIAQHPQHQLQSA